MDGRANECTFQWMNRPSIEIRGGPQGELKGLLMPTQPLLDLSEALLGLLRTRIKSVQYMLF